MNHPNILFGYYFFLRIIFSTNNVMTYENGIPNVMKIYV